VQAAFGGVDRVDCGPGRDVVSADLGDHVANDCEVVDRRISVDASRDPGSQHETAVEPASFSFGTTVAALFLFGRTPGMTLAGLALQPDTHGRRPTFGQAASRWLGTALCAVSLGLPVLLSGSGQRTTPADRMSGRPLVEE